LGDYICWVSTQEIEFLLKRDLLKWFLTVVRFKVFERIADAGFGRLRRILGILVQTVLIKKLTFRKALAVLQPLLKPV
jgi:hypothetical protein